MDTQFNEELIHLAYISSVAVRIQNGGGGHWVADIDCHDLIAAASRKLQNVDVFTVGKRVHEQEPSWVVLNDLVGRWVWWEKSKLCSHG